MNHQWPRNRFPSSRVRKLPREYEPETEFDAPRFTLQELKINFLSVCH